MATRCSVRSFRARQPSWQIQSGYGAGRQTTSPSDQQVSSICARPCRRGLHSLDRIDSGSDGITVEQKSLRIYDTAQSRSANIGTAGGLVIVVHSIEMEQKEVLFVVNPNVIEYDETPNSQSIGFEAIEDTRMKRLRPESEPLSVPIDGVVYRISVASVGCETLDARQRRYCDFTVTY